LHGKDCKETEQEIKSGEHARRETKKKREHAQDDPSNSSKGGKKGLGLADVQRDRRSRVKRPS